MANDSSRQASWQLFAISFCALFLELMLIRWVPAVVRLVAYYANLLLISSFLGLGAGGLLASRRRSIFGWFPVLLAAFVGLVLYCKTSFVPGGEGEVKFFTAFAGESKFWQYVTLVMIFALNAAVFVPIGQRIGSLFQTLSAIRAYTWDLVGSLVGTLAFCLFSFTGFSPEIGMAICMACALTQATRWQWTWFLPLFGVTLAGVVMSYDRASLWSPYYYVTMHEVDETKPIDILHGIGPPLAGPVKNVRTINDPPLYVARVNGDFYQMHMTLKRDRYPNDTYKSGFIDSSLEHYTLPYQLSRARGRVLVLGAGGGPDVEAALMNRVEHVDAVEIDPTLVKRSLLFSASGVYDDPRVTIFNTDARAFVQQSTQKYDFVIFGLLDSQALFSSMSNIRLDGFTYTVEGIRAAYKLLDDDGVMLLTFTTGGSWLGPKLVRMVAEATGGMPVIYLIPGGGLTLCVPRGQISPPQKYGRTELQKIDSLDKIVEVPVANDDWPYLYLSERTIPRDYWIPLGIMLVISLLTLVPMLKVRGQRLESGHFLFLGCAFMLLETKSIADCSIYFGSTWQVTTAVVAGVLLMVLAANLLASRISGSPYWLYVPLFLSLAAVYMVSHETILSAGRFGRVAWTVLAVPVPLFFAGLIFSTTLRSTVDRGSMLGVNLIGAVLGGFGEYLAMATGHAFLGLLVGGAYLASLGCRLLMQWTINRSAATAQAGQQPEQRRRKAKH